MKEGTRVQPSAYALEHLRDASMGGFSQRGRDSARREYEAQRAKRGTVAEVITNDGWGAKQTLVIRWDDGTQSSCMPYMVEQAN